MLLRYTLTQVASITTEISLTHPSPSYGSPNTDKLDICLHSFIISVLCNIWKYSRTWALEDAFVIHSLPLRYPQVIILSTVHAWFSFLLNGLHFAEWFWVHSQTEQKEQILASSHTQPPSLSAPYDWMEDFLQPVFLHWPILPHKFIFYIRVQP